MNPMQHQLAELQRTAAADATVAMARIAAAGSGARGLFIDCGSNLGQGFGEFVRHYPLSHFDYVLVEPNPNCLPALRRLQAERGGCIELLPQAAGISTGSVKFFGLEHDATSQGASMLKEHNNLYYAADEAQALEVPTFSLSDLIRERAPRYAVTVLKLDIEGGEYEVLPHLIGENVHRALSAAYIEFHSHYMAEPQRTRYRLLEDGIRARLSTDGVRYRIWI